MWIHTCMYACTHTQICEGMLNLALIKVKILTHRISFFTYRVDKD